MATHASQASPLKRTQQRLAASSAQTESDARTDHTGEMQLPLTLFVHREEILQYSQIIYRALHDQNNAINTCPTSAAHVGKTSWLLHMLVSNCIAGRAMLGQQKGPTGCAVCILVLATSRGSTHDHMNMPASPPHVTAEAESLRVSSMPGSGLLGDALPGKLLLSACRTGTIATNCSSHAYSHVCMPCCCITPSL